MSATLGGLIKDYRLQKNLSQLEVAFSLGWKEASRLSRIEQGKVGRPKRALVDRLIKAMDLAEEEKNQLLLAGNYLPTKSEIERMRKQIKPVIESWVYPASLADFTWRIIFSNKVIYSIYKMKKGEQAWVEKEMPRIVEIVFRPEFMPNKNLSAKRQEKRKDFLLETLIYFRHSQRTRTKEKWYTDLIGRMMGNELFRKTWKKSQNANAVKVLGNFNHKSIINPKDPTKTLEFNFFMVPLVMDPRFILEFYTPANLETFKYFKR